MWRRVGCLRVSGLAAFHPRRGAGRRHRLAPLPPPRSVPVLVPFFTWNGFYAGINAGYGFGSSKWTNTVTGASTGNFDVDGALVGGTAGYNLQLGGWVLGIEGDVGWKFRQRLHGVGLRHEVARPRATGSARCAAGSATPSTASFPTSPAAHRSAISRAPPRAAAPSARPPRAGPRRRPRIRLPPQLVRQGRISLRRSRHGDMQRGVFGRQSV